MDTNIKEKIVFLNLRVVICQIIFVFFLRLQAVANGCSQRRKLLSGVDCIRQPADVNPGKPGPGGKMHSENHRCRT
jgi:hypothetical protein